MREERLKSVRRVLIAALIVTSVGLAFAAEKPAKPDPSVKPKPTAIVQDVKKTDDAKKLLYPAKVVASTDSVVTADLDASVKRIVKTLGSTVRRGETILWLENQDPAFTFAAVPVRAPIAGILSELDVQLASRVAKGEKLFHVVDPHSLKVEVEVPGAEMGDLRPGITGVFRWGGKGNERPVKVIGLSPVLDARSGTGSAEIGFVVPKKGDGGALPPLGSVGQASFEIKRGTIIVLPENSVSYLDGKPQVRFVDEGKIVHRRPIEIGDTTDDGIIVRSGVKEGDRVVLRASRSLKDGEEVDVQNPGGDGNGKDAEKKL